MSALCDIYIVLLCIVEYILTVLCPFVAYCVTCMLACSFLYLFVDQAIAGRPLITVTVSYSVT